MCKCVNIAMGSYANQTVIDYPFWFISAKSHRSCGIDNCILEEIIDLWESGIQTTESCCGHNVAPAYIAVLEPYAEQNEEIRV